MWIIYDSLELAPWLLAAGSLADSDTSSGNVPSATQTQPSAIGCASFAIDPKGKPWANAYWYKQHGPQAGLTRFIYSASFLFPSAADAAASQAVEMDIQQVIAGVTYNFGFQFDFAEGQFRVWNRAGHEASGGGWNATEVPMPRWEAGEWVRVEVLCHRTSGSVTYDQLIINGVSHLLGQSYPAPTLSLSDMLNCAVQLDGNGAGAGYRVVVDDVSFQAFS